MSRDNTAQHRDFPAYSLTSQGITMNKTTLSATVVVLGAAALGLWFYQRADAHDAPSFRLASIEQTDIESTVSSTGALSAVRTVQVGTQVSGQISALLVDFNDHVKKGQLLARIDPTLQQQAVADAQAGLERTNAQLEQAKAEYDRNKQLVDAKIVTESEFSTIQANYSVAKANVRSAQIALDKAKQNLAYTNIYAPIEGVIVSRAVDIGQTVAASLSTPELFRIAEDLTEMQILASVDESDIGKIATGQPVTFTVAAYPTRAFSGKVQQMRLQSATTDNVVNYTVVVSVSNEDGKLLPGMTATLKFMTNSANGVLAVPNAALRFVPTAAMLGKDSVLLKAPAGTTRDSGARRDSSARQFAGGPPPGGAQGGFQGGPPSGGPPNGGPSSGAMRPRGTGNGMATIWVSDSTGKLTPHRVRTGLTDGQKTQIMGRDVVAGMKIVIGLNSTTATATTGAAANPFQQQQQRGPGGPRGPGGF